MPLSMAKKALLENRAHHLDDQRDPMMSNLHVALYQIVEILERIEEAQIAQARAIAQLASRQR